MSRLGSDRVLIALAELLTWQFTELPSVEEFAFHSELSMEGSGTKVYR